MPASLKRKIVPGAGKMPAGQNTGSARPNGAPQQNPQKKIQSRIAARGANDPTVQQWQKRLQTPTPASSPSPVSGAATAAAASGISDLLGKVTAQPPQPSTPPMSTSSSASALKDLLGSWMGSGVKPNDVNAASGGDFTFIPPREPHLGGLGGLLGGRLPDNPGYNPPQDFPGSVPGYPSPSSLGDLINPNKSIYEKYQQRPQGQGAAGSAYPSSQTSPQSLPDYREFMNQLLKRQAASGSVTPWSPNPKGQI